MQKKTDYTTCLLVISLLICMPYNYVSINYIIPLNHITCYLASFVSRSSPGLLPFRLSPLLVISQAPPTSLSEEHFWSTWRFSFNYPCPDALFGRTNISSTSLTRQQPLLAYSIAFPEGRFRFSNYTSIIQAPNSLCVQLTDISTSCLRWHLVCIPLKLANRLHCLCITV